MTETETHGLPANPDTKRFVLGSLLLNDDRYADVATSLVAVDSSLENTAGSLR